MCGESIKYVTGQTSDVMNKVGMCGKSIKYVSSQQETSDVTNKVGI